MVITQDQVLQLLSTTGYAGMYCGVLLALLCNTFFLFDDGINLIYFGTTKELVDSGWLYLLCIPIEMVAIICFIIIVTPYIAL